MTQKYCCQLAKEIETERTILKTNNFFVIPTLGSMGIEGYLLVIPIKHYHAIAEISRESQRELEEITRDIKKIIFSEYGLSTLIFEHGPRLGNLDSGQSIDHAHLHFVPGIDITENWAKDLMYRLGKVGQYYKMERIQGFSKAKELLDSGKSYLYLQNLKGIKLLSEQNFHRPSQYFRTMVANQVGSRKWNWRFNPDKKTIEKTVTRLKGKI
jgi:diadenosine tetraphosphate (Ap4A) HIT family hydrolase